LPPPAGPLVMTNRFIIPLLCAASVAFARGTSSHKETLAASTANHGTKSVLTSTFSVNAKEGVEFKLDVRNNTTRMVELRFPAGKTHDFVVLDASGKEVWRWSEGRMFTQAVQNKLVKGKDTAIFSEDWRAKNMRGKFTAIATLESDNHPIVERVEFELK
jgi:hypothetical protein